MVGAAGLEPATLCLEGRCSIHLSYAPMTSTISQNGNFALIIFSAWHFAQVFPGEHLASIA